MAGRQRGNGKGSVTRYKLVHLYGTVFMLIFLHF